MKIIEYLKLIRVHQWYKNLLIFLPVFFVGELLEIAILKHAIIGFIALCLVSSANYVINDIIDIKRDRLHPEKKYRPLASGKVSKLEAIIIGALALTGSIIIALNQNKYFFFAIIAIFILTLLYSIKLKDEPILDVMLLSVNFVLRAVSGALLLGIYISPWLIVCPFFLALFLAVGKRGADIKLLKDNAVAHKKVLQHYEKQTINDLMIISTTCLIISYSIYAFSRTYLLLITIPFAAYTIFRYYLLANQGSEIARNPEKAYKDYRIVISALMWIIITFVIIYISNA
jgi:4-hydroxybenzoate polyprenyltransferase